MEAISVKLDKRTLENLDLSLKQHNYTTRTDFIREAIRDKLKELEKDNAIKELKKFLGAAKSEVSNERHEKIREEVVKKHAKKFDLD